MNRPVPKNGCPCNGCQDRTVECHSTCERYPAWVTEQHAKKTVIIEARMKDHFASTLMKESNQRAMKGCISGK